MFSIFKSTKIRFFGLRVKIFKSTNYFLFFNLIEQKLHIYHNLETKIETQEGLNVLENALHVSAKSAENSAHALCAREREQYGEHALVKLVCEFGGLEKRSHKLLIPSHVLQRSTATRKTTYSLSRN
jgi:hypothetical protein